LDLDTDLGFLPAFTLIAVFTDIGLGIIGFVTQRNNITESWKIGASTIVL